MAGPWCAGPVGARRLAAISALVALVSGCSSTPEPRPGPTGPASASAPVPASSAPAPSPTQSREPVSTQVWRTTGNPFTELRSAGGYPVGLEESKRRLFLVGLDPATGKRRWKQEASPGSVPPGIGLFVTVVKDAAGRELVVYLRPVRSSDLSTRVVVADPATGKDVAVTKPLMVISPPDRCADGKDVCVSAYTPRSPAVTRRLRLSDGSLVTEDDGAPDGAEPLTDHGLIRFYTAGGVERIGVLADRQLLWSRRMTDLFGAGYTSNRGWNFSYYPEQDVFVGSVGGPAKIRAGGGISSADLADNTTVGFAARTGKRLWRDRGTSWQCWGGLVQATRTGRSLDPDPGMPLRCRTAGRAVAKKDRSGFSITGLKVTLERLDPATGKSSWRLPLGAVPGMDGFALPTSSYIDATHTSVPAEKGTVVVDLGTGALRPAVAGDRLNCPLERQMEYRTPFRLATGPYYTRYGSGLFRLCDGAGKPVQGPPPPAVLDHFAAAGRDGVLMLAVKGGWVGYRVG